MYLARRDNLVASARDLASDYEDDEANDKQEAVQVLRSNTKAISQSVNFIDKADAKENCPLSYSERAVGHLIGADPELIDCNAFRQVVAKQRENLNGPLSLTVSILFFFSFANAAFLHEDITNSFILETGIRNWLTEGLNDVESTRDVWTWLNDTVVPRLFDQEDVQGRPLTDKRLWSKVLAYNQLQGPMRLRLLRSKAESCNITAPYAGRMLCYPQFTSSRETFGRRHLNIEVAEPTPDEYAGGTVTLQQRTDYYDFSFHATGTEAYDRRLREAPVQVFYSALPGGSEDDSYNAFIFPNTNRSLIQDHMNYLYGMGWLDPQSKSLQVKALLVNPEVGRPRLIQIQVDIYFSRGGGILAQTDMMSLFLEAHYDAFSIGVDMIFIVMLLAYTVTDIHQRVQHARRKELIKGFTTKPMGSMLQMSTILGGWVCVGAYAIYGQRLSGILDQYERMLDLQLKDTPADYPEQRVLAMEMQASVSDTLNIHAYSQLMISYYHLVLTARFFTAFRVQPRLGVVLGTLQSSLMDILHTVIVLIPTFIAYSLCGVLIFGRRLEEFSHPQLAIGTCFKMLVEGEYDWPRLSEKDWVTAAVWAWSFMVLMVVLMVNLLLAIIMDVYTEKRKQAGASHTICHTFRALVTRLWHWRRWVPTRTLEQSLSSMERLVTKQDLRTKFPGIASAQLDDLIIACDAEVHSRSGGAREATEVMRLATAARLTLTKVTSEIQQLCDESSAKTAAAYRPCTRKRGYIQYLSERMAMQNHKLLAVQWQLQQLSWQWNVAKMVKGGARKIL